MVEVLIKLVVAVALATHLIVTLVGQTFLGCSDNLVLV
ncbi:hypothetical protein KGO5_02288 [Sinorhizobium sp. KGO-5]|nr:hypothetical protein KGO5_02288 [Sinorhizobium sp. KGO-5]